MPKEITISISASDREWKKLLKRIERVGETCNMKPPPRQPDRTTFDQSAQAEESWTERALRMVEGREDR